MDHTVAAIDTRQRFSFTAEQQEELYLQLRALPGILGSVILSTCNRTELWLSCAEGTRADPFAVLCQLVGAEPGDYEGAHFEEYDDGALTHLCLLACGAKSSIWGEDQILSQVKTAIARARECRASDSVLEVVFRTAVTCGKRVKTEVRLTGGEHSIADRMVDKLHGFPDVRRVLVIGNGEIGRLAASALHSAGYEVTMTVRTYRHAELRLPENTRTLDYAERYDHISEFDAIASATRSPHYTVETARLMQCPDRPPLYFDLAVPRDIETSVRTLGCKLYDVDSLGDDNEALHAQQLREISAYIEKYKADFYKWQEYRSISGGVKTHFPVFLDISGQTALVVGAGKIATRRVNTLRKFAFRIVVVAPHASDEIRKLAKKGALELEERPYRPEDVDGALLVVAATDSRQLNQAIGERARNSGKLVSVADCAPECSFYFPAVINRGEVTVAVSGDGKNHHSVSSAAREIREYLNYEDTDSQS